jgi:hypothetical protein
MSAAWVRSDPRGRKDKLFFAPRQKEEQQSELPIGASGFVGCLWDKWSPPLQVYHR